MNLKQSDHKETALRCFLVLLLAGIILGNSMNKILIAFKLKKAETNLVSLTIKEVIPFPVWPSFICGQGITNVIAHSIKRGKSGQGDELTDLPTEYISPATTNDLAPGDWTSGTGTWPCFVFNTNKRLNFTPGIIDQVRLTAITDQTTITPNPTGLLFGIFDAVRILSSVDPFVGPLPSRNTFTFTKNQRFDVDGKYFTYFFVNKQNILPQNEIFESNGVNNGVATFAYSPDTYIITTYTEQRPFTPYGLISAVGGLITYAIAAWVILFGRGKYRSWGLIQRYLLRNSPDASKNDSKNRLLPNEKPSVSDIESQNNITLVGTPSPGSDDKSFRPTSAYYFTASGNPNHPNYNSALSPNSTIISPSNPNDARELNKLIDAKINQKLWFVEQTLSRHYLAGFRLRRYDVDSNKLGHSTPHEEVGGALTPPTVRHSWNNLDPGHRVSFAPPPTQKTPSPHNSHNSNNSNQNNNNSVNSFNPEEQRSQYPNVAIGQVPIEKKMRGSGIIQYLPTSSGNDTSTEVATGAHDGNYYSNVSTMPSSYLPNVPIQLAHNDNSNINPIPPAQLQVPHPQGSHNNHNNYNFH
jgi:hypothetical protein